MKCVSDDDVDEDADVDDNDVDDDYDADADHEDEDDDNNGDDEGDQTLKCLKISIRDKLITLSNAIQCVTQKRKPINQVNFSEN